MKPTRKLYICPLCGYIDHDDQDGTGHWEQGTSVDHLMERGWSYWTLQCNGCGEISDMREATKDEIAAQKK